MLYPQKTNVVLNFATHTKKTSSSQNPHNFCLDFGPRAQQNNGYVTAAQAHTVEGAAGNGDDGGGGGAGGQDIITQLLCTLCGAFCKDNPLGEQLGLNQQSNDPPANVNGGGGGGRGGRVEDFGGGGGNGYANNDGQQRMNAQAPPITSQSKHKHDFCGSAIVFWRTFFFAFF